MAVHRTTAWADVSHAQPPAPPAAESVHAAERPDLPTIVRRVSASLLVACVVPMSLFLAVFSVAGVRPAMAAALCWAYGAIAWRALTRRRTSGLLVLTAIILTGRTAVALAADSTFLYFLQPIISDGVVGLAFLLSLASARPMVARLAGDFYPMNHALSMRPGIRRLFSRLTLAWAALCLGKAVAMLWLLQSQTMHTYVVVQTISAPTINALAAAATITAAVLVARTEGLLPSGRHEPLAVLA